ncbi:TPA: type II toxin-antitoxin system PemK/MazF family toxin, partial [Acinetobacter baumannii]|nr:type II toxin-antitoxin system PemK/MazF family toxin [Acinetobacter baumannii]
FIVPEMVKNRPALVIKKNNQNAKLVTILPISTTKPEPMSEMHIPIAGPIDGKEAWIKCDMLTTVCIERLDRLKIRKDNKNEWVVKSLEDETFELVKKTIAKYFNF